MPDSNRKTGFKLPLLLRARQGVAISWYRVANLHNPPGDSHGLRPRNDIEIKHDSSGPHRQSSKLVGVGMPHALQICS